MKYVPLTAASSNTSFTDSPMQYGGSCMEVVVETKFQTLWGRGCTKNEWEDVGCMSCWSVKSVVVCWIHPVNILCRQQIILCITLVTMPGNIVNVLLISL